ncbi:hypothetical protein QFC21_006705 [Naganishia friedmannii]|uniref:Uncharacterized protein n=1 Tax=Naganishia friedmannii TaxID=89922 RepID=A0ACC2V0G8_9TREE|nr:hypothetical protein QFC21_006705 [Naganishia friedmannii]
MTSEGQKNLFDVEVTEEKVSQWKETWGEPAGDRMLSIANQAIRISKEQKAAVQTALGHLQRHRERIDARHQAFNVQNEDAKDGLKAATWEAVPERIIHWPARNKPDIETRIQPGTILESEGEAAQGELAPGTSQKSQKRNRRHLTAEERRAKAQRKPEAQELKLNESTPEANESRISEANATYVDGDMGLAAALAEPGPAVEGQLATRAGRDDVLSTSKRAPIQAELLQADDLKSDERIDAAIWSTRDDGAFPTIGSPSISNASQSVEDKLDVVTGSFYDIGLSSSHDSLPISRDSRDSRDSFVQRKDCTDVANSMQDAIIEMLLLRQRPFDKDRLLSKSDGWDSSGDESDKSGSRFSDSQLAALIDCHAETSNSPQDLAPTM